MNRLVLAGILCVAAGTAAAQQTAWTGSWATAPVAAPVSDIAGPEGMTYRNVVHLSVGGRAIRLRISNEFGSKPLTLDSVHAALSSGLSAIQPKTDHVVTFGGVPSVTIPTGSVAVSDSIALPVRGFANIAVSIFVPKQPGATLTYHSLALSSNYMAAGNVASASSLPSATKIGSWYLLKGIEVEAAPHAGAVVVLGASITDGFNSSPEKNARWPDVLAARLQADPRTAQIGVLNEGIAGGRLLHDITGPSGLARLDRDVLAQPGAKYLIVSLGTNDIGRTFFPQRPNETVTAEQIIWGLRQIVLRAHASGIKVYGATLNPFGGANYWNAAGEQMRQAVNAFTRSPDAFDGVIDFDKATRNPTHPETLLPAYDSGDHLHPNDAGYKVMAGAIDLKLFTR